MSAARVRAAAAAALMAAAGLLVLVLLTVAVTDDPGPTGLDSRVLDLAEDLNGAAGVAVAKLVTLFGSLPVTGAFVIAGAVMLGLRHRPVELVVLVLSILAVYVAVHLIKAAVDRPRPPDPVVGARLSAFPSGHAAYSTVYVALAVIAARGLGGSYRRYALVAAGLALAVAIGVSRAYLRVHWATDVLAGWALGAAIFGALAAMGVVVGHFRHNGDGEPAAGPAEGNAPRT